MFLQAFKFFMVMLCTYFCLTAGELCSVNGMLVSAECDGCKSNDDASSGYISGSSRSKMSVEGVCTSSHSFCFPSTLSGFLPEDFRSKTAASDVYADDLDGSSSRVDSIDSMGKEVNQTWSSDRAMFKLFNGKVVSCSLNSRDGIDELSSVQKDAADESDHSSCRGSTVNQKSPSVSNGYEEVTHSESFAVASRSNVGISPPVMDWGERNLFFPSVAYLTVANTCNDSILHIYEPFSTNLQFYTCNFSEISLGPGEVASICFIFLPRWLGLSTAHLVLQTSSGGFMVQARGFTVESPYGVKPIVSLNVPYTGRVSKKLALLNPLDETLFVERITAWISVSVGNTTHHIEAICSTESFQGYNEQSLLSAEDWLVLRGGPFGFPLMAMRPYRNWEVNPSNSETVIELDLSFESQGKVSGAICLQLLRSSQVKAETIMVPLDVDLEGKVSHNVAGSASVSFEILMPYDSETCLAVISLRNDAPYMLSVVKIIESADNKFFNIKYMEGLLLFPGAVTQVAAITCAQLPVEVNDSPKVSNIIRSCKIFVLTNDSSSPQIEVPCEDVIHSCLKHQKDSSIGYTHQNEKVGSGNLKTASLDDGKPLEPWVKALETKEAGDLILENWKSQGFTRSMSVLEDLDAMFPIVQVGTNFSKWITVRNPSKQPVVMQLILNSGEIIDECQGNDDLKQLSPGGFVDTESAKAAAYGFSLAENALTEAYVHPQGRASFGPILFHPSSRCRWRSSALVRNNLSGVEWISLRGFGGSFSLLLLEGSESIQSVEFNLNVPIPLNISLPDMLFQMEETTKACTRPFFKELYAKNTGNLPLQVKSVEISGSVCGLDGFMVHNCKGFYLEPGESTKLLISYQAKFSAATAALRRDLELALATGVLVIPLKASLPVYMLNACKKSMFWMRVKKLALAILPSASLFVLVIFCVFPRFLLSGSQDCFYKSEKSQFPTTNGAKPSHGNQNQRNKFSVSADMVSLLNMDGEDKLLKQASNGKYLNVDSNRSEPRLAAEHGKPTEQSDRQMKMENLLPSSLPQSPADGNSDAVEVSQPDRLTVRTGKEKGRRRRKRKGIAGALAGLVEVSSSQSGNSTPSSPLSPPTSITPNRTWLFPPDADQSIEIRNPFTQMADKTYKKAQVSESSSKVNSLEPKVSVDTRKYATKPVLSSSASFPSAGRVSTSVFCSSPLAATSTIAPHARAPGSKLYDHQKTMKAEGETMSRNAYTYDIWGDHLSGLHMGRSGDVGSANSSPRENGSDSFFVRGPQALMTKPEAKTVSFLYLDG